jgi:hypothetical protein
MPWTPILVGVSLLGWLADNQTVMSYVGSMPYPWGAIVGTTFGLAAIAKRYWLPSTTPTQFLNMAADPKFLDRVIKLADKLAERKVEKPPDIIIKQKDGSEFRISSDIPEIPGQINPFP